ncbi:hypothetical protein Pyn_37784 [Prunus yedoensis var. nudiflora]|uniref:Uncharacterized protein n=1 Tax=Prunus yedoensis var. nudiflora TaxID=2094558 RepID=A0A314XX20_PRUYE|nr:hypothetical protein Pyn_11988 [Prunus yedoensis var. nudiflora]PQP99062.1 hypothetical protein Pyn_37784 [Prunus yedoensis var. nudiflora]
MEVPAHGGASSKQKSFKEPRDISTQGGMPSLEPAYKPIFFPSSNLAMEKGRKKIKKMGENRGSPLKQPREEALSPQKSLILWDWAELIVATIR